MNSRSAMQLATAVILGAATVAHAQSPQNQPLVQAGNLVYLGKFTLPKIDGTGRDLIYGGAALGIGPDGQSLYYGCTDGSGRLARVSIPAMGGVGAIVEPCVAVPNLQAIKPTDTNGIKLGGSLSWNGRLIVSAYTFYDGSGSTAYSHFAGSGGVSSLTGPYRVGIDPPGMVGGYMGAIPQEWRGLLGGPAVTGKCCTSIIWRSSYGPSISVFDPDHVGTQAAIPSTMLIGYPEAHQTLGAWDAVSPYYTGTMRVGGVAFPAGTRSVLFVARRGESFCYGDGAQCNDPSNPDKGTHGYPYRHVVLAYDANDMLAVKQGTKMPWQVLPYAQWTMTEMANDGTADMTSAVYDPATRRWYVTAGFAGGAPVVHVYDITNAVLQPPPPAEVCGDGIDNDGDGLVDENCTEVCGDGIDNDRDGLVDEGCQSSTAKPSAPVRLEGAVSGSTVSFRWSPPLTGGAVTGYELEAGLAPGVATVVAPLGLATDAAFPNIGAGRYYVRVRARNGNGPSPASNEVAVSVGCSQRPSKVSGIEAASNQGVVTFTWTDPDGCSGTTYSVGIGTAPGTADVQVLSAAANSATTLLPAGTFYARIAAVADSGVGDAADLKFTVRENGCAVPRFRTRLTSQVTGRHVAFAWSPLDPDLATADDAVAAVSYVIEVGSVSGATDIGAAPMNRAWTVATLAPPGVYFVRVRPMNACGAGIPSSDVRVEVR